MRACVAPAPPSFLRLKCWHRGTTDGGGTRLAMHGRRTSLLDLKFRELRPLGSDLWPLADLSVKSASSRFEYLHHTTENRGIQRCEASTTHFRFPPNPSSVEGHSRPDGTHCGASNVCAQCARRWVGCASTGHRDGCVGGWGKQTAIAIPACAFRLAPHTCARDTGEFPTKLSKDTRSRCSWTPRGAWRSWPEPARPTAVGSSVRHAVRAGGGAPGIHPAFLCGLLSLHPIVTALSIRRFTAPPPVADGPGPCQASKAAIARSSSAPTYRRSIQLLSLPSPPPPPPAAMTATTAEVMILSAVAQRLVIATEAPMGEEKYKPPRMQKGPPPRTVGLPPAHVSPFAAVVAEAEGVVAEAASPQTAPSPTSPHPPSSTILSRWLAPRRKRGRRVAGARRRCCREAVAESAGARLARPDHRGDKDDIGDSDGSGGPSPLLTGRMV